MGVFDRKPQQSIENIPEPSGLLAQFLKYGRRHFYESERVIDALLVQVPYEDLDIMMKTYAPGALFLTPSRLFAFGMRPVSNQEVFATIELATVREIRADPGGLLILQDEGGWMFPQPDGDVRRFIASAEEHMDSAGFAAEVEAGLSELPLVEDNGGDSTSSSTPRSLADEIRKLADLRSEGILSTNEFDDAKRRLLREYQGTPSNE